MEDATRATVHDDRFERQGTACLWTAAAEARPPLGAPLRGEVLWQTPDGYVELERPPEREGGPRARLADVGRKSTQVLVTKVGPAAYAVSVNGETVALPDGVARSGRQPVTLTSFEGPYCGADNDAQTVVGPVSLGLLAANGQRPPTSARVTVVQRAMVNGDEFFEQVLSEAELPCGDAQAASLPVLAIPFPARFTESPFIEIQNVAAQRAAEAKALWGGLRYVFFSAVLLLILTVTGIGASSTFPLLGIGGTMYKWVKDLLLPIETQKAIKDLPGLFFTGEIESRRNSIARFLAFIVAPIFRLVKLTQTGDVVAFKYGEQLKGGDAVERTSKVAQKLLDGALSSVAPATKDYHKYTLRAVSRTLRALMAADVRAVLDNPAGSLEMTPVLSRTRRQGVFGNHKNETTMLDYLNEQETGRGVVANKLSGILQYFGLGLLNKRQDALGNAQAGLFFSQVGKPRLRGLDPQTLRVNYVTTQLWIDIVDSEGTWRIAIQADAETGFRAGYYASGVAEDVREFNRTIEEFSTKHGALLEALDADTSYDSVASDTAATKASLTALFGFFDPAVDETLERASPDDGKKDETWSEKLADARRTYREVVRGVRRVNAVQLIEGAKKLERHVGSSLTLFASFNGGLPLAFACDLGVPFDPPSAINASAIGPLGTLLRVRPQRAKVEFLAYSVSTVDYVGVSKTDQVLEELSTAHPVDGAIDECRRSLQSYSRSLALLWSDWESRSTTRMRWYELFELREGASNTFDFAAAAVSVVGAGRLAFTADGVLFPLEVRDRLEWWVDAEPDPELANAIGLVSTKPPTRYSDTKEAREQANVSPNGNAEQVSAPKTLAELLAAQAIADCLAARTVARATLPKAMRVSTNATDAVRSMVPRILEVLSACRIDDPMGIGGVLADNDPLFACVPGGIEAARLLHCLGAWRRREDVTLAVNAPVTRLNIDLTRTRRVARSNAWPKEAEAQLKAVSAALRRVSVRAFAAMPIYALQNTLAWTEHREADALTARLCEAVASFDRTEQLALELGLAPAAVNPIRLRVVAHWPVVLSALIGLETDAKFRELLTRIAPTVEAWKSLANDRAKPLLGSSGAGILAALAARNARLRVDRAHLEEPDLEGDRAAPKDEPVDRAYFVPFAHGSPPHSHIWSAIHPGSRGLDSVPIGAGYLSRATRDCKAAAPGGDDDAADVTIEGDETSTHPFGIALRRGVSERAIRAQCHLVAVTSAEPVGASASPAPLDLGLAAEALVQGTGEPQRGSLVDVIGWNAERLLQAALLALNVNGKCALIECEPPLSATTQLALVDAPRKNRDKQSHTRLLKWEIQVAVDNHLLVLEEAYRAALDAAAATTRELLEERNAELEEQAAVEEQDRAQALATSDLVDDLGLDKLSISGAGDGKERAATTGAIPSERVENAEEYASSMWREEQRQAFLQRVAQKKHPYSDEDALKYDCAHVEALVRKMVDDEAADVQTKTARQLKTTFDVNYKGKVLNEERASKWQGLDSGTPEEQEALRAELRDAYAAEADRLFAGFELAAAHNHINAKHAEYFEHVGRVKDAENKLAAAKEAQELLAATLRTRNADAFHASVALAGAMLKALLGEDRAPRLRVAAGVAPPAWLTKADALRQDRLLSLFEVALVFDQLVRGPA